MSIVAGEGSGQVMTEFAVKLLVFAFAEQGFPGCFVTQCYLKQAEEHECFSLA